MISAEKRREELLQLLKYSVKPMSGSTLAKHFGVSRQVIVQDIALLRAVDKNILSTAKGYLLYQEEEGLFRRVFPVTHTNEEIQDELFTFVDNGGKVLDVIVEHKIYGSIAVDLILKNRLDVKEFVEKLSKNKTTPLMELTDGFHFHTVEADSEKELDCIEKELKQKGYLID